jgi:hypothetical protein
MPARNVAAMRQHIISLCETFEIAWYQDVDQDRSFSVREFGVICTPPVAGSVVYAIALHVIGHIRGCYLASRRVIVRERWAGEWARRNARIWTPAMEQTMRHSLSWYEANGVRLDRKQRGKQGERWATIRERKCRRVRDGRRA